MPINQPPSLRTTLSTTSIRFTSSDQSRSAELVPIVKSRTLDRRCVILPRRQDLIYPKSGSVPDVLDPTDIPSPIALTPLCSAPSPDPDKKSTVFTVLRLIREEKCRDVLIVEVLQMWNTEIGELVAMLTEDLTKSLISILLKYLLGFVSLIRLLMIYNKSRNKISLLKSQRCLFHQM